MTLGGGLTIPFVHTDFIFTAVAEAWPARRVRLLGFGAVIVFRGLRIAALARDDFSALLATGLTATLGLQTLIIIGGSTKLIPLTGITLPFVSYGGSSVAGELHHDRAAALDQPPQRDRRGRGRPA